MAEPRSQKLTIFSNMDSLSDRLDMLHVEGFSQVSSTMSTSLSALPSLRLTNAYFEEGSSFVYPID